jgi:glycosyltransferase involved in cell wall biosynthesis
MNIGILIPGFSSDENDWSIPVQQHLARILSQTDNVRIIALRYPYRRTAYRIYDAMVYPLGYTHRARGLRRMMLWLDTLLTVQRLHRERRFDVLHAMWADETGLLAVWAGRRLNVPSVVSIVGGELVGFPELNYGLQRSAFSRWIVGRALKADCVVAASEYARRLIPQAGYDVPEKRVRVIALGVDAGMFAPLTPQPPLPRNTGVPASWGDGEIRLIHVASLVPIKDQAMLLRAVARLGENVVLDILGTGTEENRLRELATELGISQRVIFVGAVGHTDLPAYYRRAALHVITSRHEGQALVTVEAAACGIPTVGTDVGILADVQDLGIAVPVGDDEALAAAIQGLLSDDERRIALGQSARAAVEREYTIERTAEQYRELYRTLRG